MDNTTLLLIITALVIIFTYQLSKWLRLKSFFKKLNIPGPTPWPLIGNMIDIAKNRIIFNDMLMIKKYGKICGYFEGSTPNIVTTDVKFMKNFMIKDFNSFANRRTFDDFMEEPLDKFLTVIKDEEWKNVRSILSTTFSSGKLKLMSKCIKEVIKNYDTHLESVVEKDGIIQTKLFYGSYTLDVISSCCFGIDTNSIADPNNEFLVNLQKIFKGMSPKNPKLILAFIAPKFAGFLSRHKLFSLFPSEPIIFLQKVSNEIIQRRRQKLEQRDDFIQIMLEYEQSDETKKEETDKLSKKSLTDKEILAQAILFLAAGYETTATTLEWITYNLALNPDVQEKLIQEIDSVLEKYNGEINYDSIGEMKFLSMVIDETLRLFPPASRLDRIASSDYEYEGVKIKKGQVVTVAIYALHHDQEIYEDPESFKPERFSDENKKKRDNEAFIPFGAGPRNCIAMRFALMEIKLLVSSILSKYRFSKCEKTPEKIVFDTTGLTRSETPIFIKVSRR